MNISSNEKGLGGALTNPTVLAKRKGNIGKDYPVFINNLEFADAEDAYQALKTGIPLGDGRKALMTKILQAKLIQHKHLVLAIMRNGGSEFILTCDHIVSKDNWWEGKGINSPFIRCLYYAYNFVSSNLKVPIE